MESDIGCSLTTIFLCRRGDGGSWQLAWPCLWPLFPCPSPGAVRSCSAGLAGSRASLCTAVGRRVRERPRDCPFCSCVGKLDRVYPLSQSLPSNLFLTLSPVTQQTLLTPILDSSHSSQHSILFCSGNRKTEERKVQEGTAS